MIYKKNTFINKNCLYTVLTNYINHLINNFLKGLEIHMNKLETIEFEDFLNG